MHGNDRLRVRWLWVALLMPCVMALMLLAVFSPAGAQWVNPDTCSWSEVSCQQAKKGRDEANAQTAQNAQRRAEEERALRQKLLRLPLVPKERNVLLGSWRLEDDGQRSGAGVLGSRQGTSRAQVAGAFVNELAGMLQSGRLFCLKFQNGITFAPSTFLSSEPFLRKEERVAYRSDGKQVIWAIPDVSPSMAFEIVGPNRIVIGESCALVRVGSPAANAAANATTAPGSARTAAANSSAPPTAGAMPQVAAVAPAPLLSTLARPSPEVCRHTLLDKLGVVGSNQVRAMSDVRFKEAAIEGKVPNTNHLRIDLRGSACDDPRVKATLYDFDANEMLQSITYVWERPAGPAPAPNFQERVTTLSRFHSLPPPQSPGRLQADTSLGRLILQDVPERNQLLEAYAAKK